MLFQISTTYLGIRISILPQGHAMMSILIAYLGVSKVNLAYDRFMACRLETGRALNLLREMNQYCITMTEADLSPEASEWRKETKTTILQLIQVTVTMIKNSKHAQQLATNVIKDQKGDPFEMINYLRSHMYQGSKALAGSELQLLERCKLMDVLHEFTASYRELVRLASTPIPFALVQMGRTFMFIWVLSLPLVLSGKDFNDDITSVFMFVILLTYGFLGLEMVAMIMSNPFGDEASDDLNVKGLAISAMNGITNDSNRLERIEREAKEEKAQLLFSQRFLNVPKENLDDSKDELEEEESVKSKSRRSKFALTHWKNPIGTVAPYFSTSERNNNDSKSSSLGPAENTLTSSPSNKSSKKASKSKKNSDDSQVVSSDDDSPATGYTLC